MPEPDFESIARTFMRDVAQLDSGGDYTAETKAEDTLALAEQLRQVWNARRTWAGLAARAGSFGYDNLRPF